LRWRGVEATLQLAQSTNTKVVIIGAGKDGLPIILGNADGGPPAAAPRGDDEAAPKKTTTATGPTVPLEKMRGSALATPGETVPVADTAKPAEKPSAGQETPPAAAKSQGILGLGVPFSFSDLASFYMRYVRPTRPWDHPAEDASGPAAGTKQQ
jgi:hypothetical protein